MMNSSSAWMLAVPPSFAMICKDSRSSSSPTLKPPVLFAMKISPKAMTPRFHRIGSCFVFPDTPAFRAKSIMDRFFATVNLTSKDSSSKVGGSVLGMSMAMVTPP